MRKISTRIELKSRSFEGLHGVVIMLHGYGDKADNFCQIGEYFASVVPNRIILIPSAILELPYGYAWFHIHDLSNIDGDILRDRVEELDDIVASYLDYIADQYNCKNIEVIGFSQGAMLAMRSLYLSNNIRSILASSGIFYAKQNTDILSRDARVLITHGVNDSIVPFKYCDKAYEGLTKLGLHVDVRRGDYGHTCDGLLSSVDWFLD